MNNMSQLIQMVKNSNNPQQMAINMLRQNSKGNPMLENLINLASNGNTSGVEEVCRNILRSSGYDPDELMNQFMGKFK